ncbi:hypothetical protein PV371_15720 [Streptomyces sp. TX20-6-3]|uniref:hypothetical protein n=1 Tax=Streptomyces sp. TX20-6-3 TaxID=3028705 RepID=UPI0029BB4C4B|nr:hypothetical protein [Streptomyces sp. TX20-6-3]MDX2561098.1 hypothetical protein [Streptomyces sp. TX20-6-3]
MICPHCAAQLAARERTGQTCSRCERRFALDPKLHGRGMHDLRIRRVAERATDGGRLKVTLTQLWYLSRVSTHLWDATPARGIRPGVRWAVAVPLALLLLVVGNLVHGVAGAIGVTAAVLVVVVASFMRYRPAARAWWSITPSESAFRQAMTGHWRTVYKQLPPGVVEDDPRTPAPRESVGGRRETTVILCTDHAVAVFLRANALPAGLKARLVEAEPATAHEALADVPAGLPVVVLHDASALGALLAPLLRLAHPGRVVVDAGLPASAVRTRRGAVHRIATTCTVDAADLRSVAGLSEEDAAWLAGGRWSPLAAVPPTRLEAVVTAAVERALSARPAELRSTDGFLTWPAEAPARAGGPSRTKGTTAG